MKQQLKKRAALKLRLVNPLQSVGMKLFAIIFCGIVACVMTVGLIAYGKAKETVEMKAADASLQTVKQIASNLNTVFKNYEDMTMQLMVDKDFHEMIRDVLNNDTQYTKSELTGKLKDRVHNYVMGNVTVSSVVLLPLNEALDPIVIGNAQSDKLEALREAEWFQAAIDNDSRPLWIPPQQQGFAGTAAPSTVGMSRLIKDNMSNKPSYLLLMEIQLASIVKKYEEVEFGEGSQIAIIDEAERYVAVQEAGLIGQAASVSLTRHSDTGSLEESDGSLKTTANDGTEVLAAYAAFDRTGWRMLGTVPVQELAKASQDIQTLTWVAVAIAALIAAAIGGGVIWTIARPLVKLRNLMNEGAEGDLAVRSELSQRRDEIGELSASFNRMMGQIHSLALQTTRSAEEVLATAAELTEASRNTATAAKEIAIATDEIAGGAASLAIEAERGADLAASIDEQMKSVVGSNGQMELSALEVKQAGERGTDYMRTMITQTGLTEQMTRAIVDKVEMLKSSTQSISSMLDMLTALAKQTNILSLNASIEAARAGAAGKGFVVVADEIRELADKSRQSIAVVSSITEHIRAGIDEAAQALGEAYPLYQEQISSVKEASQLFVAVQGQMELFSEKLELATASISELNEAQAALTDAMTNVNAVAEQSSATSQEVASLSGEQLGISDKLVRLSDKLEVVSQQLQQSLSQFRIHS